MDRSRKEQEEADPIGRPQGEHWCVCDRPFDPVERVSCMVIRDSVLILVTAASSESAPSPSIHYFPPFLFHSLSFCLSAFFRLCLSLSVSLSLSASLSLSLSLSLPLQSALEWCMVRGASSVMVHHQSALPVPTCSDARILQILLVQAHLKMRAMHLRSRRPRFWSG